MIIKIKNLRANTIIGVFDWEKEKERELIINLSMDFDGNKSTETDDIKDTLDYDTISKMLVSKTAKTRFDLIEKLAAHLLDFIMEDKRITSAIIEIDKPGAIDIAESVSVTEERKR